MSIEVKEYSRLKTIIQIALYEPTEVRSRDENERRLYPR
jgi:hypothetical protein